ncbi:MAG: hypothetical protein EBR40_11260 [Proteobacteria bacterium]|nr:hypothetical protein [Pseudomonadota bacterium]
MGYLIGAFAVFYVYNLLTAYLSMPKWAWQIIQVLLSAGAWWALGYHNPVAILGIAGMASLVKGTEALLLVTRDRVTVEFLRSQRR